MRSVLSDNRKTTGTASSSRDAQAGGSKPRARSFPKGRQDWRQRSVSLQGIGEGLRKGNGLGGIRAGCPKCRRRVTRAWRPAWRAAASSLTNMGKSSSKPPWHIITGGEPQLHTQHFPPQSRLRVCEGRARGRLAGSARPAAYQ